MAAAYDYLFLNLRSGGPVQRQLAQELAGARGAVAAAGGEVLGQFSPQLGWATDEAAVLIRWPDGRDRGVAAVTGLPIVAGHRRWRLQPTVRPADGERPRGGGIYVHRWFTVAADSVEEFVALSAQAWPSFEGAFATNIFGLFLAESAGGADEATLLLITRYADHGVWEASRDPTTDAMQIFQRRQALTRRSWAASSLLVQA